MATPNKDEFEGKWEQLKGSVKDKAGELTNDEELEAEGEVQHAEGEAQESWGKTKRKVGEAVKSVGDKINS